MRKTTIWLEDADYAAIEAIRTRWGTSGTSDTIRLALRAYAFGMQIPPLAPSPADLEWNELRRKNRDDIASALGIPFHSSKNE